VGGLYLGMLLLSLGVRDVEAVAAVLSLAGTVPIAFLVLWALSAPALALWCLGVLRRPETRLIGRLGAIPAPTCAYEAAKSALEDVSIASGTPVARLAIIPDASLNAFVVAHRASAAWIGATSGLLDALSQDELRAVFAHLAARIADGSAATATVMAEFFDAASGAADAGELLVEACTPDTAEGLVAGAFKEAISPLVFVYAVMESTMGLSTSVIVPGYRASQEYTAECADAEGMLLVRDPKAMLGALEKVLPKDNRPGTVQEAKFRDDVFGALFFAWPAFSFADDPELVRIDRLREVLGASGA
jgi:hypothetical protein